MAKDKGGFIGFNGLEEDPKVYSGVWSLPTHTQNTSGWPAPPLNEVHFLVIAGGGAGADSNGDGGDLSLVETKGVFEIDENISEFDFDFNNRIENKARIQKISAGTVAKIMATEMNKSNDWINNEIKDFQELSLRYQLK